MLKTGGFDDDLNWPEPRPPKWLDSLVRSYFDDPPFRELPADSRTRAFKLRGMEVAMVAHSLCRLRRPVRDRLAYPQSGNIPSLLDLVRDAAGEAGVDPAVIAQWLNPEADMELRELLRDPKAFAKLAAVLEIPLATAIQLLRAASFVPATVLVGNCSRGQISDEASAPSTASESAIEEVEAVVRNHYRDVEDLES